MLDLTRSRLRGMISDETCLSLFWLCLGSLPVAEIAARSGADAVVVDLQHGLWDRPGLESALLAVGSAVPVIARVAENSASAISLALDAGAEGVLVPLIDTAEGAARAVSFSRFPPAGQRSGGGVRPVVAGFSAYIEAAATRTVVGVMIETVAGVENAEAIAATPGLDFILIGTGDLALSVGGGPAARGRVDEACARILEACRSAGLPCGIFTPEVESARARRAEGFSMVVLANDMDVVAKGFGTAAARFQSG